MNIVERYNLQTNHIRYDIPPKNAIEDINWDYLVDSRVSTEPNEFDPATVRVRLMFHIPNTQYDTFERMARYFQSLRGQGSMEIPIGGQFFGTRHQTIRNVEYSNMATTMDRNGIDLILTIELLADRI